MMDVIPAWAMDAARKAIAEQNSDESLSQVVARALIAEREKSAKIAEDHYIAGPNEHWSFARHALGQSIAAAIRKGE